MVESEDKSLDLLPQIPIPRDEVLRPVKPAGEHAQPHQEAGDIVELFGGDVFFKMEIFAGQDRDNDGPGHRRIERMGKIEPAVHRAVPVGIQRHHDVEANEAVDGSVCDQHDGDEGSKLQVSSLKFRVVVGPIPGEAVDPAGGGGESPFLQQTDLRTNGKGNILPTEEAHNGKIERDAQEKERLIKPDRFGLDRLFDPGPEFVPAEERKEKEGDAERNKHHEPFCHATDRFAPCAVRQTICSRKHHRPLGQSGPETEVDKVRDPDPLRREADHACKEGQEADDHEDAEHRHKFWRKVFRRGEKNRIGHGNTRCIIVAVAARAGGLPPAIVHEG